MSWRNDPKVFKWCRQNMPLSAQVHERWFNLQDEDPTIEMFHLEEDGYPVGVCGLTSIDYINSRAEFSFYIAPKHQGKGYAKTGMYLLLEAGFGTFNLNQIWGEVFEGNPAIELFTDIGFSKDGFLRDYYYREGKYIGAYRISMMKDEWEKQWK